MTRTQLGSSQIKGVNLSSGSDDVTGTLPVANGGTGNATNTAESVLVGNGTAAVTGVAPSAAGNVLTSNGTSWASSVLAAGTLMPVQAHTDGSETYTISSGTVTQIAGLTINGGTYTPSVNDRILILNAPAATGGGSLFTPSANPGNGIYVVTSLAGGNIAVSRAADMSGSRHPAGMGVYSEYWNLGWVKRTLWVVTNPFDASTFTYGSGVIEFQSIGGRSLLPESIYINNGKVGLFNATPGVSSYVQVNSATPGGGDQTLTLPAPTTDTILSRTSTDDITNKRATLAAGSTTVAPLKLTSGTNLTTPAAGAVEFDGATFMGTIDTTSGRGLNPVDQMFRLSADGSAIGNAIADYFSTNSAFPYVASAVYEIVWYLLYTKTTAGTVTYTITGTTTPTSLSAWYTQTPIGGIGTAGTAQQAAISKSASATAALPATGSLTTAVAHQAEVHAIYEANTAGNLRLRVTESAGTVTPLRGSFYRVRRLPAGNVGTFVA